MKKNIIIFMSIVVAVLLIGGGYMIIQKNISDANIVKINNEKAAIEDKKQNDLPQNDNRPIILDLNK